jgi:hypothetical protein
MFCARFDESRDTKGQKSFAIAGYIGRNEDWLELEPKLERFLQKHNLMYFKASECESGTGQFLQFRENPLDAALPLIKADKAILTEIKTEFVDIANSVNLWGIGAHVPIEEFNFVVSSDPEAKRILQPNPYFICFQAAMTEAGFTVNEVNEKVNYPRRARAEVVAFVFDGNEEVSGRAKQMYDNFQIKNPISSQCFGSLAYEDEIESIGLQVADNLVYEIMKFGLNSRYDKGRLERKAMTRLKEKTKKIYAFDRPSLQMLVRGNLKREVMESAALHD